MNNPLQAEAIAQYLLDRGYQLTALELLQELREDGRNSALLTRHFAALAAEDSPLVGRKPQQCMRSFLIHLLDVCFCFVSGDQTCLLVFRH
jgi:hypothetical protein